MSLHIEAGRPHARRLSLTSLIDVIFLLLLFFMLSSTFTRFAQVEFAATESSDGRTITRPDIIVQVGDLSWTVNGQTLAPEGAVMLLLRLEQRGAERALIKVGPNTTTQVLLDVLDLIRHRTKIVTQVTR